MILRSIVLAGTALMALGSAPAGAQTVTQNLNNTGIPRQAPPLSLSSIYGLNPCSSGVSLGVSTPLFGVGGAVADIDKECETRNNAAVVITGLKDEMLAREILCQIKDIRQAAIRIGKPCLQDQPSPRVASAEPANSPKPEGPGAPTPTKTALADRDRPAASTAMIRPVAIRLGAPLFCRLEGLDVRLYPDCIKEPAPTVTAAATAASAAPVTRSSEPPPAVSRPLVKVEWRAMPAIGTVQQASWHAPLPPTRMPEATRSATTSLRPAGCSQNAASANACEPVATGMQSLERALLTRRLEAMASQQSDNPEPARVASTGEAQVASLEH